MSPLCGCSLWTTWYSATTVRNKTACWSANQWYSPMSIIYCVRENVR